MSYYQQYTCKNCGYKGTVRAYVGVNNCSMCGEPAFEVKPAVPERTVSIEPKAKKEEDDGKCPTCD